jgi:MYXO-CTERM domain-containing protein
VVGERKQSAAGVSGDLMPLWSMGHLGRQPSEQAMKNSSIVTVLSLSVAALAGSAGAAVNLVNNGNFQTEDFSGWTQWGDPSLSGANSSEAGFGSGFAYFAPFGVGGISQGISTVVGEQYTFSFDLSMTHGTPSSSNSFFANFGALEVMSYTDRGAFGWTHYSFDVIASDATSQIKFGFYNSPAFMFLDNVSVTATPAPGALALLGAVGLVGARRRRA